MERKALAELDLGSALVLETERDVGSGSSAISWTAI
jgi:hypothetical protein